VPNQNDKAVVKFPPFLSMANVGTALIADCSGQSSIKYGNKVPKRQGMSATILPAGSYD
jgi:hypothetical protein